MATICNIFSPLDKPTGNFLMFSPYISALNEAQSVGVWYDAVPAHFYVLNITLGDIFESDPNIRLPQLFQNRYENWLAYWRDKKANGETNIPSDTDLLWYFIYHLKDKGYISQYKVLYDGKISMQSYNDHGGESYNEIVCHIPSEDSMRSYKDIVVNNVSFDELFDKGYIYGYNETGTTPLSAKLEGDDRYIPKELDVVGPERNEQSASTSSDEADKYTFNTVIAFFDHSKRENDTVSDAEELHPLGIYFTGTIKGGEINNERTIYLNNPDAFGTSTTYALRLCTRYAGAPTGNPGTIEVSDDHNIASVLAAMYDTMASMKNIVNSAHIDGSIVKDALTIFRNNKTNIPYIKTYQGELWWFVNGRAVSPVKYTVDTNNISEINEKDTQGLIEKYQTTTPTE